MIQKQIGKVEIFEVLDDRNAELAISKSAIQSTLAKEKTEAILMNIYHARLADHKSVDVLLETFWHPTKRTGILVDGKRYKDFFHSQRRRNVDVFLSYGQALSEWGDKFITSFDNSAETSNKRQHARTPVALHVEFTVDIGGFVHQKVPMIATNLSPAGLFAEFLDSMAEYLFKKIVDKTWSRRVQLELQLEPGKIVRTIGRIAHGGKNFQGVGVEFVEISNEEKCKVVDWLLSVESKKISRTV